MTVREFLELGFTVSADTKVCIYNLSTDDFCCAGFQRCSKKNIEIFVEYVPVEYRNLHFKGLSVYKDEIRIFCF